MNTSNLPNVPMLVKRLIDLLRDTFSRDEYGEVILPFMLLRRLDCVLMEESGRRSSPIDISNTSQHRFNSMLTDPGHLGESLRDYVSGFSGNVREILSLLGLMETITRLEQNGLLLLVMKSFAAIDLHPQSVPPSVMGNLFEEVIRECDGISSHPGEHFTPPDVTLLMALLLLANGLPSSLGQDEEIAIYDPGCGSGGLLFGMWFYLRDLGMSRSIAFWGQEVNPVSYALCKAECYLYGFDAGHIALGNTLTDDRHAGKRFSLMLANPPFGQSWRGVQEAVVREAKLGDRGRFAAGLPPKSDGQLLFLQHVLSHMKDPGEGESRIAILLNGSANTSGDAGSGESEIRRFVLERDWLEAIVGLPESLFQNTGIHTYLWLLSNRKPVHRRGSVQLINAVDMWTPLRRSQGNKRRELTHDHIARIAQLYLACSEGPDSRVLPVSSFGYRKIIVERPLRLNFQASSERIARLTSQKAFTSLATRKARPDGLTDQQALVALLTSLPAILYKDRKEFLDVLEDAARRASFSLLPSLRAAILAALSERDETAEICRNEAGNPEPDPALRDSEKIPLDYPRVRSVNSLTSYEGKTI